jgi:hypothetical protein
MIGSSRGRSSTRQCHDREGMCWVRQIRAVGQPNPRCTTRRKTGEVGAPRPMKMGSIASPWRAMTSRAAAHNCWQGHNGATQGTALVVLQAPTKRSYDVS